jgi:hypothetical protein
MKRTIVIGDLHGDYSSFLYILEMCGLINKKYQWIGENTTVIQVGDTLDGKRPGVKMTDKYKKSSGELKLFNFINKLNDEAKEKGGKVISILGNHEVYPFYLKEESSDFSNNYIKKSDKLEYLKELNVDRWDYYSPGNEGARQLGKTRPFIHQEGKFLFVHGSLTDEFIKTAERKNGKIDIKSVNKNVSDWLQGKRKAPAYLLNHGDINPLFNRDLAKERNISKINCNKYLKYLKHFNGVEYIIMGHTVQDNINSTCDGKFIRTDVAISRAFGGTLESKKDKYEVLEIIHKHGKSPEINVISTSGKIKL